MVLPIWISECDEPLVVQLIEELNISDEASSDASHPVSKQHKMKRMCGNVYTKLMCIFPQLLAKVRHLIVRMCEALAIPVPPIVAELFSLASSAQVSMDVGGSL